jgi:Cof subfamily protein (haloacid dehalogenase superfamily)
MTIPFRLAAIDLDETLLGPDNLISRRNARAVHALRSAGVVCIIASGRMHEATIRFADELGLDGPIISYNGAMVKVIRTGEVWHHLPVPADAAAEVIRYCADRGLHLNYYLNDRLYVAQQGEWARFYLRHTGSPMEELGDLGYLCGTEPTKMILIDTPEVTDRLQDEFKERFGPALYIMKTNPEYLEFMHPTANKGAALSLVASRLGVRREETIAFGDGANDLPMLEWAGLPIAMHGAGPAVRAVAARIAPPYNEDGLAMVIERILEESSA